MKEVENMRASLSSDLIRVVALVSLVAGIGVAFESGLSFSSVGGYLPVVVPIIVGVALLLAVRTMRHKSQKEAYRLYLDKFDDEELIVSRKQSLSTTSLEILDGEIKRRAKAKGLSRP